MICVYDSKDCLQVGVILVHGLQDAGVRYLEKTKLIENDF